VFRLAHFIVLAVFALQAAVIGYFLGGRVPEATVPEPHWRLPDGVTSLDYQLGDAIALRGYTTQVEGDDLELTLYWRATGWPRADYLAFVHLLDQRGNLVAQSDSAPAGGTLPTWCWVPGEVVEDRHLLPGMGTEGEGLRLGVGLYEWTTGARLPVVPPQPDEIIPLPIISESLR
jgi:hypothetical protein